MIKTITSVVSRYVWFAVVGAGLGLVLMVWIEMWMKYWGL